MKCSSSDWNGSQSLTAELMCPFGQISYLQHLFSANIVSDEFQCSSGEEITGQESYREVCDIVSGDQILIPTLQEQFSEKCIGQKQCEIVTNRSDWPLDCRTN